MTEEAKVVDLSDWAPDQSYDDGLKFCLKLELIETVQHGEHDYGRLTENGRLVLFTLLQMAGYATNPKNVLKTT